MERVVKFGLLQEQTNLSYSASRFSPVVQSNYCERRFLWARKKGLKYTIVTALLGSSAYGKA